jgi:hypothetical protein
LVQRLPVYPEFVPGILEKPGRLADRVAASMDMNGYARRAA